MAVDTLEKHIFSRLDAEVSAIGKRIYPDRAPDNANTKTNPFVRYSIEDGLRHSAMGSDTDIVTSRVQIDVYAKTAAVRRTTADSVRVALQRYRATVGTHVIEATFVENE